jgi:uncharacterized protein
MGGGQVNQEKLASNPPKRLLALDGGGIRGVISLGILEAIERMVGQPLGDYFDYVGGTSTGAIIATGLSLGLHVSDLLKFYQDCGTAMFEPRFLLARYKSLYASDPLKQKLQEVFGSDTRLGSDKLKSLLLVVTRNWSTDSPWPISSNPQARYNRLDRNDCNLKIPLWQLVRASTAAPVYFPPEIMNWDAHDPSKAFVFVDGGVTPYNNPAFLLYRMATLPQYGLNWKTGEDKMLVVSVGTGSAPKIGPEIDTSETSIPAQLPGLISALMYGAEVEQDINCRTVGRCTYGNVIDSELGDMVLRDGDEDLRLRLPERLLLPKKPLSPTLGRAFLYARYNPELTDKGLKALGITDYDLRTLLRMDIATKENIDNLLAIGRALGKEVTADHFGPFLGEKTKVSAANP